MDTAIGLIVVLPVFSVFLYKLLFPIGIISAVIEDWFELFSFFWVNCVLIDNLSTMFRAFLLWLVVLFVYNKIKG